MMENIQLKYGRDVWKEILQAVINHSECDVESKDLEPETPIEKYFPRSSETGKNRLGCVMSDVFDYVNEVCGLTLGIDYPPRSEYFHFPQLQYIWIYFMERIELVHEEENPVQKKKEKEKEVGKIIPFPNK